MPRHGRTHGLGKLARADLVPRTQGYCPFDDVAQLPDVSRPVIFFKAGKGLWHDAEDVEVVAAGEFGQELDGEEGHATAPLPQRRQEELDHVQAEIEIGAEP